MAPGGGNMSQQPASLVSLEPTWLEATQLEGLRKAGEVTCH